MIKAADLISKFRFALENKWGYIWGTVGVLWTQAKQAQKVNYMIQKYGTDWKKNADAKKDTYYMAASIGSKWIGHTVADCSGLFKWAFIQLGGNIYHGSNTIYDKYCSTKGKLTEDLKKTLQPGAAVFVDKNGNKSHIGLYVGNGKVIEACSTEAGVCTSNLTANKWSYYGLLKDVQYGDQPEPGLPTLKKGDKGPDVKALQVKLIAKGYKLPKYGADGDFGSETETAVKAFQKDHGLNPDGIVGEKTWEALEDDTPIQYYKVTVSHLTESNAKALCGMYEYATMEKE